MKSLCWNQPLCTLGCFSGLKLKVVFEMIGPSFFEHNMRFLYYSAVLCIQINRLQSVGQA